MNKQSLNMRFFSIVLCLIVLLCVTACSNQDIIENEQITPSPTRTLKLNAAMPGDETKSSGAATRLSLTDTDEGTISVKWKEGDKINLCFVNEDGAVVRTISNLAILYLKKIIPPFTLIPSHGSAGLEYGNKTGKRSSAEVNVIIAYLFPSAHSLVIIEGQRFMRRPW